MKPTIYRNRRKFAWLPLKCSESMNGPEKTIWLQFYWVKEYKAEVFGNWLVYSMTTKIIDNPFNEIMKNNGRYKKQTVITEILNIKKEQSINKLKNSHLKLIPGGLL